MADTKTELCNIALSLIGNEQIQLTDFDTDTGASARQCRLHYQRTLEEVIRLFEWNCCKKQAEPVATTTPDFGWDYAYTLPSDCILPVYVTDSAVTQTVVKTGMEYVVQGRTLLCNQGTVYMEYLAEPAIADMDSLFVDTFTMMLAIKIAVPLGMSMNEKMMLLSEFRNHTLPEARRVNGYENKRYPVVDSEWLEETYSSGLRTAGYLSRTEGNIPL